MAIIESTGEGVAVGCDAPGCAARIGAMATDADTALDIAEGAGWSINPHSRGNWCYCPRHAGEYAGKTPRGRPLIGW